MNGRDEIELQRGYYAATAKDFAAMHTEPEHELAQEILLGLIAHHGWRSLLDVGAGTGRLLSRLRSERPEVVAVGIEPVAELRQQGYAAGLPAEVLLEGDATRLAQPDGAVDVVCAFGVLHHIRHPRAAVREMLRVARRAVFISDSNNFGQGSGMTRAVKQAANAVGLWPLLDRLKTGGKGYRSSPGDGISYSYSLFNDLPELRRVCPKVHLFDLSGCGGDLYRRAAHVAVAAIKRQGS